MPGEMASFDLTELPKSDPTPLLRYRDGIYAADFLACAILHLDLFNWLTSASASLEEICEHCQIHERPADVLMTLACANGLVEKEGDRFLATELCREHLGHDSPWALESYYASLGDRPVVKEVLAVLRTGKPGNWESEMAEADWHESMESAEFARMFTAAMDCRGVFLGQRLATKLDLAGRSRVLDIGGGSGIYACCLVAANEGLGATVFEKSPVEGIAESEISRREMSDRIKVLEGDMFEDAYPDGHDVHLLSNVLHDWDLAEVEILLRKSHQSLPCGGLVVAHETFLNEEKTGPRAAAEYSTVLVTITQGRCYGVAEIREMMERVGFADVQQFETGGDRSAIMAFKP